jgi:BirA family biotin operon repressor/biotin-[acetyl-CoA-carboxylase] ligase
MFERAFVMVPLKEIISKDVTEILPWVFDAVSTWEKYEGVKIFHPKAKIGRDFLLLDEVTSTNDYLKEEALNGAEHGLVVVANRQTQGRGRLGRKWSSDSEDGIWLSVLIRPENDFENINDITRIFAVSIVKTLDSICEVKSTIKWPNDIILDNRKVSGILCESYFEGNKCKFVIVGVGINVCQKSFDDVLKQSAISLKMYTGKSFDKRKIIDGFIKISNLVYDDYVKDKSNFNCFYKKNCVTLGKEIKIVKDKQEIICKAIDIYDNGNLMVEYSDNSIEEITSGEVSVRGINNYV